MFINGGLLHYFDCSDTAWTEYLTLPIRAGNVNTGGGTTNSTLKIGGANIARLGPELSAPTYKYINSATTTVCKYGAGSLHRIVNCDNVGSITIYDSATAAGPIIASMDLTRTVGSYEFNVPFYYGLTIVSSGPPIVTVVYE
jgi:hypothetical protein